MTNSVLPLAAFSGLLSVALGAFGAHALRESLDAASLEIFKTGTQYQMLHALAALAAGILLLIRPSSGFFYAGVCFLVGSLIFSGTLYLIVFTGARWWGAITPIGGLTLMAGWLLLAITSWKLA